MGYQVQLVGALLWLPSVDTGLANQAMVDKTEKEVSSLVSCDDRFCKNIEKGPFVRRSRDTRKDTPPNSQEREGKLVPEGSRAKRNLIEKRHFWCITTAAIRRLRSGGDSMRKSIDRTDCHRCGIVYQNINVT